MKLIGPRRKLPKVFPFSAAHCWHPLISFGCIPYWLSRRRYFPYSVGGFLSPPSGGAVNKKKKIYGFYWQIGVVLAGSLLDLSPLSHFLVAFALNCWLCACGFILQVRHLAFLLSIFIRKLNLSMAIEVKELCTPPVVSL